MIRSNDTMARAAQLEMRILKVPKPGKAVFCPAACVSLSPRTFDRECTEQRQTSTGVFLADHRERNNLNPSTSQPPTPQTPQPHQVLADADPDGRKHCIRLLRSFEYRSHVCLVFEAMVRRTGGSWLAGSSNCLKEVAGCLRTPLLLFLHHHSPHP
jgi:hypothetical protein